MNHQDVRIAIDAMGGDNAPDAPVAGASRAARTFGFQLLLVGDAAKIKKSAGRRGLPPNTKVVDVEECVAMDEAPGAALRRGASTSMGRTIELLRENLADAAFSAGNSGAFHALATIRLRPLPGIARPAIATAWPAKKGPMLLIDAGANVDCRPEWLAQFALMGTAYAHAVLGIQSPKVGLLSIGEEAAKGNALTEAAYPLLQAAPINFIGNVEGRDLLLGDADVIVCDGFVGNVALKLAEAASKYFFSQLRVAATSSWLGRLGGTIMRPTFRLVRKGLDDREYGGAPLLGLRAMCLIGHGRADAYTVESACRTALRAVEQDVVGAIAGMTGTPARRASG